VSDTGSLFPLDIKCQHKGCGYHAFRGLGFCVLHCHKNEFDYNDDYDYFVDTLRDEFQKLQTKDSNYLKDIHFPDSSGKRDNRYETIFCLKSVIFQNCFFYGSSIEPPTQTEKVSGDYYFSRCTFLNDFTWLPFRSDNPWIFSDCHFNGAVKIINCEIEGTLFSECEFSQGLDVFDSLISGQLFIDETKKKPAINRLFVTNSRFVKTFSIKNLIIENVSIMESVFENEVDFGGIHAKLFELIDCMFHANVVFSHATVTNRFFLKGNRFLGFVGFEGFYHGFEQQTPLNLSGSEFRGYVSFVQSRLFAGLVLSDSVFYIPPNFYGAKINTEVTNRETLRLIKHTFDSVGNKIEGNKWFVFEMEKYATELKATNCSQEKLVVCINKYLSKFGQSYLRPFGLLFFAAVIHKVVRSFLITVVSEYTPEWLRVLFNYINDVYMLILPFLFKSDSQTTILDGFFYVFYSICIWQIIVAVKRKTRR